MPCPSLPALTSHRAGDAGPAGAVPEFWGLREFDAFLLVVDDVPWGGAFNPALTTLNLRDVDRIEVLRGPAPVTYGATSFVGAIHVVHKGATDASDPSRFAAARSQPEGRVSTSAFRRVADGNQGSARMSIARASKTIGRRSRAATQTIEGRRKMAIEGAG